MLIVWGKRACCLGKERTASQRHYAQGAGRLPVPKSGKSVLCLALGLGSIGAGPLTAIPALVVGALAWKELRRHPTWMRGRSLVVVGVMASCAGTAASAVVHVPQWRLRSWLTAMEQTAAAKEAGDREAAIRETERALKLSGAHAYAPAVTRVRRGDCLMALGRYDEAVEELSAAIEQIEALAAAQGPYDALQYEGAIAEWAHERRAEAYEQLGQEDKAQTDRKWHSGMLNSSASPQFKDEASPGESDEAPPAPPAPAA
jgi:hypothetical protein